MAWLIQCMDGIYSELGSWTGRWGGGMRKACPNELLFVEPGLLLGWLRQKSATRRQRNALKYTCNSCQLIAGLAA